MIRENQIKDAVVTYLENQDLDGLEQWLAQQSWNMHLDSEPCAQSLATEIQMLLAEHNNSNLSGLEIRRALLDAVENQTIEVSINAPVRQGYSISSHHLTASVGS